MPINQIFANPGDSVLTAPRRWPTTIAVLFTPKTPGTTFLQQSAKPNRLLKICNSEFYATARWFRQETEGTCT